MPETRVSPDLPLLHDALMSSTLNHGLQLVGDRWTAEVLLGAFVGVRRFDDWLRRSGMPRPTLSSRLKALMALGVLRAQVYQERPVRQTYHLTPKGRALYGPVLMIWDWEHRWGDRRDRLPQRLVHRSCGQRTRPTLVCAHCRAPAGLRDLRLQLRPNPRLLNTGAPVVRTARIPNAESKGLQLGLRVDRWCLLIVTAVMLGCHYFDELSQALGIVPSVLSRRLAGMCETGLLQVEADRHDARRRLYRLTDSSRDLFGYLTTLSTWASFEHLKEPSSIRPHHLACRHAFVPLVACSHCRDPLLPRDVVPEGVPA